MLLTPEHSALMLIDVQDRLVPAMENAAFALANIDKLLSGCAIFEVPVLVTEQNPDRLGATLTALTMPPSSPRLAKMQFDATRDDTVLDTLKPMKKKQIILAGLETHVCVLQTAAGLMRENHDVFVVSDAVMSRRATDRVTALSRLEASGAQLVTTEMVLFEWLGRADTPAFRALLPVIR